VSAVAVQRTSDGIGEALSLAAEGSVSAVMCPTDLRALEMLRAASSRGMSVPGDVSVTGCDGVLQGLDLIGLTSVRLPVEELASRVVGHLVRLMQAERPEAVHESLRGTLDVRRSVGAAEDRGPGRV
jgi:LacI family transcriptional regulator